MIIALFIVRGGAWLSKSKQYASNLWEECQLVLITKKIFPSICEYFNPSIDFIHFNQFRVEFSGVTAYPSCHRSVIEKWRSTWTDRQSGLTHRFSQVFSQSWITQQIGQRGQSMHSENMQTKSRRAPSGQWTQTHNLLAVRQRCKPLQFHCPAFWTILPAAVRQAIVWRQLALHFPVSLPISF